jgi:protein-tyrosine phosphatase
LPGSNTSAYLVRALTTTKNGLCRRRQAEFELLPDGFPDRTHETGDRPINRVKNRYPDIKCYDQTRVKLTPLPDYSKIGLIDTESNDGSDEGSNPTLDGSDYINANLVVGYKDRKKWICAQGPLDHTVGDFWRMIHEQVGSSQTNRNHFMDQFMDETFA